MVICNTPFNFKAPYKICNFEYEKYIALFCHLPFGACCL
jgi:hypothetical protein